MNISVTCSGCGKVLRISEAHAGKTGRCPNCKGKIDIPGLEEVKQRSVKGQEQDIKQCPTCGSYLNPNDVICISCYTNLATGEWELNKAASSKGEQKQAFPFLKFATGIIAVVLFFILGYHLMKPGKNIQSGTQNPPIKKESHTPLPISISLPDAKAQSEFEKIQKLPEDTSKNIRLKIETYENWINKNRCPTINLAQKSLKDLRQNAKELAAQSGYKVLISKKDNEVFKYWEYLNGFIRFNVDYQQTETWKKITEEKEQTLQKLSNFIKQKKEEALNLLQKGEPESCISFISSEIVKESTNLIIYPNIKEKVEEVTNLSQKAIESVEKTLPKDSPKGGVNIKIYEQDTQNHINNVMKKRDYKNIEARLKEWHESLQPQQTDSPDVVSIKKNAYQNVIALEQDIKDISRFLSSAEDGIRKNIGEKKKLYFKDGELEVKIGKYIPPDLYLITDSGSVETAKFLNLQAKSLFELAMEADTNKFETLSGAVVFLLYEGETKLARLALQKLSQIETDSQKIKSYRDRVIKEEDKEKSEISAREKEIELKQQQKEEIEKAKELESQRNTVLNLIKKLLEYYKNSSYLDVFKTLKDIKSRLPVAELKKLDEVFKTQNGYSLGNLAENSLITCAYCKNQGFVPCPTCEGKGEITVSKSGVKKQLNCYRCYGKAKIACPECSSRRGSEEYQVLVNFFKDLSK